MPNENLSFTINADGRKVLQIVSKRCFPINRAFACFTLAFNKLLHKLLRILSRLAVFAIRSSSADRRINFFSSSVLHSFRNLFILKDFNCHLSPGTQNILQTIVGTKYLIGSSPLTSFFSMTLTPLLFFTVSSAIALLLISLLFLPLLAFPTLGRCFRTWALITSLFSLLFLFLRSPAPITVILLSIFRKVVEMTLLFTLIHTVLSQRNTSLFLFFLQQRCLPIWHRIRLVKF